VGYRLENQSERTKPKTLQIPVKRNMSLIVSTTTLGTIADAIFTLCLSWFVLERTGSAFITSAITAITYIVNVFAGPLIGVFVDRTSPKNAMIRAYIALGLIGFILIFFYLFLHDYIIVAVMAMVILNDIAQTFISPSRRRMLPNLVGTDRIAEVSGYLSSAGKTGILIGNAVGGILLSLIGFIGIMFTHSFIFLFAALLSSWLVLPKYERIVHHEKSKQKKQFWREFKDGAKLLLKLRVLLVITLINMGVNIVSVGHLNIYIFKTQYGATVAQYGFIEATGVATSIITGLFIGRIIKKIKPIFPLSLGLIIPSLSIALIGFYDQLFFAYILIAIQTFFLLFYTVTVHTLLITLVQPEYRARIDTLVASISSFAMPLTVFLTGYLADIIPVRYIFYFTGIWGTLMGIIPLLSKEIHQLENL